MSRPDPAQSEHHVVVDDLQVARAQHDAPHCRRCDPSHNAASASRGPPRLSSDAPCRSGPPDLLRSGGDHAAGPTGHRSPAGPVAGRPPAARRQPEAGRGERRTGARRGARRARHGRRVRRRADLPAGVRLRGVRGARASGGPADRATPGHPGRPVRGRGRAGRPGRGPPRGGVPGPVAGRGGRHGDGQRADPVAGPAALPRPDRADDRALHDRRWPSDSPPRSC